MSIIANLREHQKRTKRISFEFFPPKSDAGEQQVWSAINRLSLFGPSFVSVTYGAGGSTRERTHRTVAELAKNASMRPAAHLTCVDASKDEVDAVVDGYAAAGVKHIVALRGDAQNGETQFAPHPQGYQNAADLVAGITRRGSFDISVAAYPERHPDSPSWDHELDNLKRKVDAGASRAITQFFFDNDLFEAFVERARATGISIPIIPGVLPVYKFAQTRSFAKRCGADVPYWLELAFNGLDDDLDTQRLVSTAILAEQVFDLAERGFEDVHFYTLNRSEIVFAVCHLMGLGPELQTVETDHRAA
uniref:methylenetetrahydrofolate reductase [NAD(P)H] n=1 Tax=Pararhizobium sp. IMCC3301 TaxID=3067904 RepID=UPI0027427E1A|nr:methylenetetrahydrofolate reductase [NAD(P)H] [Pararhizobium sp. IMCC3301]